jgi:hypothetical protein
MIYQRCHSHSGVAVVKACRHNWMCGCYPLRGCHARYIWPVPTETPLPQNLHRVLIHFKLDCWELEVTRPNGGRERATRTCGLCASGAVEDELHVFMGCMPSLR